MGVSGFSSRFARKTRGGLIAATVLLAFGLTPAHADAPAQKPPNAAKPASPDDQKETLITAQQMHADQNTGIVTATGRVEIAHNGYILHADKVIYNQKTDIMHAEGHVALLMLSGEVEFANEQEITGDMKQAFARNIGIIFPDGSRMTARVGQRYDERYSVGDKANYTACNVCKENPDNPPLWDLRAKQIVHDNVEHDLYYHDATVDFAGLPIFYTPYMSGPDPTVERRQGLLTPSPGYNPNIGAFVRVPYYFDIAPNIDAEIAPTFSTTDKAQFAGEYRERWANADLKLDGSFTHADLISDTGMDEGQQWRGHLFGTFLYDVDNVWRAGSNINFTSDKSYLLRYQIASADELTNRVYVEGLRGRDYFVANSYYFEDLRPGEQPAQPLVLPETHFSAYGEPGQSLGGRWSLDGGTLVTMRDNNALDESQQGPDTRRLSLSGGWERRFVSDTGLVSTLSGLLRSDTYWADNVINPNGSGNNFDNVLLERPFAQANLLTGYPMGRQGDGYQQMVEPLVAFTAAPAAKTDPHTPNEDSQDIEFDETNLFSPNRFTGTDLIEGGNRLTYGMRHSVIADDGMRVEMFGGASYDFSKNDQFPGLSGLRDQTSDYVGRIDFIPTNWLSMNYGARLDHDTLSPQRQDALLSVGAPIFRPYLRYISAYETETTGIIDQDKEATAGFDSHFLKYWGLHADYTQAFAPEPGPRNADLTLSYTDECFIFGVTAQHNQISRADVSSGTSVVFHFYLRNVGGLHTDSAAAPNFANQFRQY